jgi:tetratricopeptide (TPR) repeat protein
MESGRGGIVAIHGDAGTGKSRLVEEFRAGLDTDHVIWIRGNCRPLSQNVPYYPFSEMISGAWGITSEDSPEAKRDKIAQAIRAAGSDLEGAAPYIGGLFSLDDPELHDVDPEAWKARTVAVLRKWLATTCGSGPAVIYVGDLHWADPSTLELLEKEASEGPREHLWIWTCRSRLSFWPQGAASEQFDTVELRNLSPADAMAMAASLLRTEAVPDELAAFVDGKAEGNPFYLEEVVNSLVESNALVLGDSGWSVDKGLDDADVPVTVTGVVSARLDRLGHDAKKVAQEASVIGRRFPLSILAQVTQLDGHLQESLTLLVDSGLVRQSHPHPEPRYEFRHALPQEVAYESLLRRERQALHERAARAYEEAYAGRLPEIYDRLAYHFSRGESLDKAVGYLMKSGKKTFAEFAIDESDEFYREAYELLTAEAAGVERDRMIVDLLGEWSYVLHTKGDLRQLEAVLAANRKKAASLGPVSENARYQMCLGIAMWCQESFPQAEEQLLSAVRTAEMLADELVVALSSVWLSYVASELGRPDEAVVLAKQARSALEPDPIYFTEALSALGFAYWTKSDAAGMQSVADELLDYGHSRSNSRATAAGYWILGQARLAEGDSAAAATAFEESLNVSPDPWPSYYARMFLGAALVQEERYEGVEELLLDVIAFCDEHGAEMIASPSRMLLGVAVFARGDMASGMKLLQDVEAKWRAGRALMRYALVQVLIGNLFLELVSSNERASIRTLLRNAGFLARNYRKAARKAEDHFLEALRVCDDVGDLQTAGESYLGLSRLHDATGNTARAREYASRAVDCFERAGLETYLGQSRELLASLS